MGRTYTIGDEKYPSVTTVLGDYDTGGLVQWSANCAIDYIKEYLEKEPACDYPVSEMWDKARYAYKEVSKEAMEIGTEVHDLIERVIKAELENKMMLTSVGDMMLPSYNAFNKWAEEANPEYIAPEMTVHSDTHKYAGTLDLVCRLEGKLYIIDFKTSKKHYPKNSVQLAAYKHAYEEMTGHTVEGVGVLRLDKVTGEYDWKDYTKVVERQWDTFKGLLQAWYSYKKRRL